MKSEDLNKVKKLIDELHKLPFMVGGIHPVITKTGNSKLEKLGKNQGKIYETIINEFDLSNAKTWRYIKEQLTFIRTRLKEADFDKRLSYQNIAWHARRNIKTFLNSDDINNKLIEERNIVTKPVLISAYNNALIHYHTLNNTDNNSPIHSISKEVLKMVALSSVPDELKDYASDIYDNKFAYFMGKLKSPEHHIWADLYNSAHTNALIQYHKSHDINNASSIHTVPKELLDMVALSIVPDELKERAVVFYNAQYYYILNKMEEVHATRSPSDEELVERSATRPGFFEVRGRTSSSEDEGEELSPLHP
jgi:hypothetical protein